MALLIGPVVALLGLVCLYYVMRSRAKTRTSLYSARRTLLHARAAEQRQRALGGSSASIPAAPQAPVQASAAAVAEAAPTAVMPEAAPPAPPQEPAWEQSPTRPQPSGPVPPAPVEGQPAGPLISPPEAWPPAPPAPEPPPPPPPPPPQAFPEPAMPAAAAPVAPPDWPSSTAPVEPPPAAPQVPIEPSMPAAEAPWAAEAAPAETYQAPPTEPPPAEPPPYVPPEPEPVAAEPAVPAGPGWSIVGQGGEETSADAVGTGPERAEPRKESKEQKVEQPVGASGSWDVVPHARGRHEELNLGNLDEAPKETIGMTLLSYAGLVGALVVVLLGVLLMVATSR